MKITATRRLQYAIGHRVVGHEGKCRHLHGHNFVFFLTAEGVKTAHAFDDAGKCAWHPHCVVEAPNSAALDGVGRVIDFGVLKKLFGEWLEREWDHGLLLWEADLEGKIAAGCIPGQKAYLLPTNPTAENMAAYLLETIGPMLLKDTGVVLTKVTVWETENGIAEASL